VNAVTCRSILRRGSRFTASDLSYHRPSRSAGAETGAPTDVDEVPPRRVRHRSTDVAGQVALLASIPLAHGDDDDSHCLPDHMGRPSLDVPQHDDRQVTALTSAQLEKLVNEDDQRRSVSFDGDLQLSPNTEESRYKQ